MDTGTLASPVREVTELRDPISEGLHLAALTEEGRRAGTMLFLNHSCDPNVGFAGNVVLVAMRGWHRAKN